MNFAGNVVRIAAVDVAELAGLMATLNENDWAMNVPLRCKGVELPGLLSVPLVFDPDMRHSHPTKLPLLERFAPALRPALKKVAGHYENTEAARRLMKEHGMGYFVRATLERLDAGSSVELGPDTSFSEVHSHRIHLPVTTSDDAVITIGGETLQLPAGELYELNNRRTAVHANGGAAARVHVVLDFVLPGEACCCGRKRHPDTVCSPRACRDTDDLSVPCECFPASS